MFNPFWRIILLIFPISVFAQPSQTKNYPTGYFRNPLNIPISLAANFGELRANHYHMGLDIRTQHRENLPVFAAQDGYISRIKIEPFGFGQAIYIQHPNGYTTLYAHLNAFYPALADYIKKQQYLKETWQIMLDLPPGLFAVKKGDLIAYSGNMGGSQGPHLHFEIRRTVDDVNLNPLLFAMPVPDNIAPVIQALAVYDGNRSLYEQSPQILPLKNSLSGFKLAKDTLFLPGTIAGFAIKAFDTQTGSTNPNGIYQADLFDNGQWVIGFQMDQISYNDSRGVNAHIDYKTKAGGGPWLQQLFQLPGYSHSIYRLVKGNGMINIGDGATHAIRIEVLDANGNKSILAFNVQHTDSTTLSGQMAGKIFYPNTLDVFEREDCAFYIGEKGLYDSVHINYSMINANAYPAWAASPVYLIGEKYIPLEDPMLVRIKPFHGFPAVKKDKVLMLHYQDDPKSKEVHKVEWQGGWASSRFREFGAFQLVYDDEAPTINAMGFKDGANLKKAKRLMISVKDNYDQIKRFRALLDGHWLRFTNDKERAFIYVFDDHCGPGRHELSITAEDEAGNSTTKAFTFFR